MGIRLLELQGQWFRILRNPWPYGQWLRTPYDEWAYDSEVLVPRPGARWSKLKVCEKAAHFENMP